MDNRAGARGRDGVGRGVCEGRAGKVLSVGSVRGRKKYREVVSHMWGCVTNSGVSADLLLV